MGFASGQSLADGWGGRLSLLEQNAVRGLRGRSTPVQEGWDTTGEGSLRSLGQAGSWQGYREGGLHHTTVPWCQVRALSDLKE